MSEQGAKEKKVWGKPEMIVLVRNKPEEVVLSYCKQNDVGTGPSNQATGCLTETCEFGCSVCNAS